MRKTIILLSAIFATFGLFAQDETLEQNETPKQEKIYLPQAGDIAVGIDGGPIFDYLGNMFNGTTDNALNLGDNRLYFRYFLTDNSAIRVVLKINNSTTVGRDNVQDDAAFYADPLSRKQLEDVWTTKSRDMELRAGYQMFRGYKRLLGFYGADVGYRYRKGSTTYQYGNEMTILNPTPTTDLFGNAAIRLLEDNNGAFNSIFAGAFAGAEYYFMPKVCIGAEFGLSYGITLERQSYSKQELMVGTLHVEEEIELNPGSRSSNTNTQFPYTYGSLYFMIHF